MLAYIRRRFIFYYIDAYYIGIARSVLALGTMMSLLFNNAHILFKSAVKQPFNTDIVLTNIGNIFLMVPDQYITVVKVGVSLLLLLVITGWRPRITCIPHWLVSTWFLNAAMDIDGGDQITANLTMWLLPICLLDNRKSHWQHTKTLQLTEVGLIKNTFINVNIIVIRLQMAVIYLHASIGKFVVPEWINGSSVYYWSFHPVFGMGDFQKRIATPLFKIPLLLFSMTWGVMILELILFAGLFMDRRWYTNLFYAGLIFHIFIISLHGLFSFCFAMTGGLVIYFLADYSAKSCTVTDEAVLKAQVHGIEY